MKVKKYIKKHFKWVGSLFVVVYLLNGCGDAFDNPCPDGDCSTENSEKALHFDGNISSSSNGGSGESSTLGVDGGSSSNGESSGGTYGFSSGAPETTEFENDYSKHETYGDKFTVVDQLVDKVVETETFFVMQYIVSGERPLTYKWYKKSDSGPDQEVGENKPFYYELDADYPLKGTYYAKVTDAKGNTIKSREAALHIIPGRNPCDDEEYGPRYNSGGRLDLRMLYKKPYLISRDRWAKVTASPTSDSGFLIVNCSYRTTSLLGSGYCSYGAQGHLRYQCQNGKFKLIQNNCTCPYYGGN